MASPRLLAICQPVARCLERRDGAGLVHLLAPFADDPDLDEAIEAVRGAFPHLRARPVPLEWPAGQEERCVAVLSAAIARPRDDTALANAAVRPTTWNWLTSLRDVLSARDHAPVGELRAALEAMEIERAAARLQALAEPVARQGWQAVLITAALAGLGPHTSVDQALAQVLASVTRGDADVPVPVVAVALAQLVQRRLVPDAALRARVVALPHGLSRDLATAAALTAWSEAGPLAADVLQRIACDASAGWVASRASAEGRVWLDLVRHLLQTKPVNCGALFGGGSVRDTTAPEPCQAETARDAVVLAEAALAAHMPVTARMAALLLRRLRRADLAERVPRRPAAETAHLAAMLVPAGVLAVIEKPRVAGERAARLLAEADAATIGRPVGAPAAGALPLTSADISICIINHNQATTTLRLLASLARLWRDFGGEVLLYDNGSLAPDLEHLAAGAAHYWPGRVRLFRSETNIGPGPARNLLFAEARTDWILSLDNDMIVIADIGRHLLPAVAADGGSVFNLAYEELDHPGLAGVGKIWSIEDDGDGGKVFQTGFAAWTTSGRSAAPTLVASNRLSGGASLFKAATFTTVGGFVAENAIGYEDYEFSLRLAAREIPIATLSVPLLVHGHLAPARANDLAAVTGRFDRAQMDVSTKAFAELLAARFGAHLGGRGAARPPHRIVPRRFDLRHAEGRGFFAALRPGAKLIGLLLDETSTAVAPALTAWLETRQVNVDVRHVSEFAEMEQALLVLQACDIIVAGPALQALSPARCRALGLEWAVGEPSPAMVMLDPSSGNADDVIAAVAARL